MKALRILFFMLHIVIAKLVSMETDTLNIQKISDKLYFEISLIPPYANIVRPITSTLYDYFSKIAPEIGYYGSPYIFSDSRAFIQFDPRSVFLTIPNSLKKNLPFLENANIYYTSMIQVYTKKHANLVFHPWVRTWIKNFTPKGQDIFFNVSVPMGIFEADGIMPATQGSIAFEKIANQVVNAHGPGLAFSPNNARFALDIARAISDFWVVAYSPDKKNVSISFVVLIHSEDAEKKLNTLFLRSETLRDFINNVKKAATNFTGKDQVALLHSADTILAIAQNKQVPVLAADVSSHIEDLSYALQRFAKALYELKKMI